MKPLKDSSEFNEAARLLGAILRREPVAARETGGPLYDDGPMALEESPIDVEEIAEAVMAEESEAFASVGRPMARPEAPAPEKAPDEEVVAVEEYKEKAPAPAEMPEARAEAEPAPAPERPRFRSEQLDLTIANMCKRGGFISSIVADEGGVALAAYNVPENREAVAALASVLGTALDRAAVMLRSPGANNLSFDINYSDKVVLRRFTVRGRPFSLLLICSQTIDERGEIELSIDNIVSILS
jgi:hypothetical protein